MAKKVQRMTYDEAAAAIDAVLARLRDERMSVDDMTAEVERATRLIAFCRERLRGFEEQLDRIMADNTPQEQ